jgi:hypothetical protein
MSGLRQEVAAGVVERIDRFREVTGRLTPGPLLVRGAVFAFTVCALLVALPAALLTSPRSAAALVLVAAVPAVFPRTRLTTLVVVAVVLAWLLATTTYAEPVTAVRLATLSCLLYLVHTTTALAAVLPYDTVLAPAVLVRWLARTAGVLALTALFAVAAVAGAGMVAGRPFLVASVVGLLLTAALAGLLAALRRRDTGSTD